MYPEKNVMWYLIYFISNSPAYQVKPIAELKFVDMYNQLASNLCTVNSLCASIRFSV
jgi:hypothetical protein